MSNQCWSDIQDALLHHIGVVPRRCVGDYFYDTPGS